MIALDCESLDSSIMPDVATLTPGGLNYTQAINLMARIGKRA